MENTYHIDLESYSLEQFKQDLESREVTKSRVPLKEDIPQNFAQIEAQGIENLQQLSDALKSKSKLADFSRASGLPQDYLVLLKREVGSYTPKPFNLSKVPATDPEVVDKLEAIGIKNTKHLFDRGQTRLGRVELGEQAGLAEGEVLQMVRIADLARIWGVGPYFTRILYEAGYDSVKAVAQADLDEMYLEVNRVNKEQGITPIMASKGEVGMCIDYAGLLPQVVKY
jgi:hypothetical protein